MRTSRFHGFAPACAHYWTGTRRARCTLLILTRIYRGPIQCCLRMPFSWFWRSFWARAGPFSSAPGAQPTPLLTHCTTCTFDPRTHSLGRQLRALPFPWTELARRTPDTTPGTTSLVATPDVVPRRFDLNLHILHGWLFRWTD